MMDSIYYVDAKFAKKLAYGKNILSSISDAFLYSRTKANILGNWIYFGHSTRLDVFNPEYDNTDA
jgi:hypothetical protein